VAERVEGDYKGEAFPGSSLCQAPLTVGEQVAERGGESVMTRTRGSTPDCHDAGDVRDLSPVNGGSRGAGVEALLVSRRKRNVWHRGGGARWG